MLLATARRRPTRSIRLATTRPPRVWTDLPLEQQQHVTHLVAVLVRRIRQQPHPASRSESTKTLT
jgi:hypothetical protein